MRAGCVFVKPFVEAELSWTVLLISLPACRNPGAPLSRADVTFTLNRCTSVAQNRSRQTILQLFSTGWWSVSLFRKLCVFIPLELLIQRSLTSCIMFMVLFCFLLSVSVCRKTCFHVKIMFQNGVILFHLEGEMSRGIICRRPVRGDMFVERLECGRESFIHRQSDWVYCQRGSRSTCPALYCTVTTQQLWAVINRPKHPCRGEITRPPVWKAPGRQLMSNWLD